MELLFDDGTRFDFNKYHGPDGRFAHSAGFAGPLTPSQHSASLHARIKAGEAPSSGISIPKRVEKAPMEPNVKAISTKAPKSRVVKGYGQLREEQFQALGSSKHSIDPRTKRHLDRVRMEMRVDTGAVVKSFEHMPTPGRIKAVPDGYGGIVVTGEGPGWKMERSFELKDGYVSNEYFKLAPEYQSKGIAKKVLKEQIGAYRVAGSKVKRVEVMASLENGGYTWAKFGFQPTARAHVGVVANARSKAESRTEHKLVDALEKKGPKGMGSFAESEFGKMILPGTSWWGSLDLKSASQMKRFDAYTAGK